MTRKHFLGLLGLIGCSEDMILPQHGMLSGDSHPILRVWGIGDSIMAGAGEAIGSNTPIGALRSWNGSGYDVITTTDISTVASDRGTWFKQWAIEYNRRVGGELRVCNSGVSGSTWAVDGAGSGNWTTSGALWAPALADAQAMVAADGPLDLILICLGINDARHAVALSTINTAIDDVIAEIVSEFPGVPIGIVQIGAQETGALINSSRQYAIRWKLIERMQNVSEVFLIANNTSYWQVGVSGSYYQGDNLHLAQEGNNLTGIQFDNWEKQRHKGYSKEALSWICRALPTAAHTTAPDSFNQLLATYADAEVSAGNYYLFTSLVMPGNFSDLDFNHDYSGIVGITDNLGAPDFVQYQGEDYNGTDDRQGSWNVAQNNGQLETHTDFLMGAMIATNSTSNPSTTALFGRQVVSGGGNPILMVRQNAATNVSYFAFDATGSLATIARFATDTLYTVGRNSGTKEFYIDGTLDASAAVAVISAMNGSIYSMNFTLVAAYNQGFTGREVHRFVAKRTGFNLSAHAAATLAFVQARRAL